MDTKKISAVVCQITVNKLFEYRQGKLDLNAKEATGFLVRESDFHTLWSQTDHLGLDQHEITSPYRAPTDAVINSRKIPIVKKEYKGSQTVLNIAERILRKISKKKGPKIFILGIKDELFEAKEESPNSTAPAVLSPLSKRASQRLALIKDKIPVPLDLEEAYRGKDCSCLLVRQRILMAAAEDKTTVLIIGESGTGKDIVAREIHRRSRRSGETFIAVNCAGIEAASAESMLFGHKKGAFTGATSDRVGLFKEAHNGVLFLNEIGALAVELQTKLLTVLDTGEFVPLGGEYKKHREQVNVRVIAATSERLRISGPLYYRLSQFYIETPSLREHIHDLRGIADPFWQKITGNRSAKLSVSTIERLQGAHWDGNVRELENFLQELFRHSHSDDPLDALDVFLQPREPSFAETPKDATIVPLDLGKVINALAEASHKAWMDKRLSEGWVWGPTREETDQKKTNPDLKPFGDLTDEQKSYSQEEARAVWNTLLDMGYLIREP